MVKTNLFYYGILTKKKSKDKNTRQERKLRDG